VEFLRAIRYEWKSMSEAENNSADQSAPPVATSVAAVVPLFPKLPGIRESLASLASQTRPPDLVVLLDDGSSPDAESLHDVIPDLQVEVVQVESGPLGSALEALSEYLANFDFITLLQAGDTYTTERIEKCAAALGQAREGRPLAMAVTGITAVDGRGNQLPGDDPRALHFERLWAPGRVGAGLADWLGTAHFAGPISNIFLRRDFLATGGLPVAAPQVAQAFVMMAGLQGLLTVVHEPLLRHYPPPVERELTPRSAAELLQTQTSVLAALRDKLADSPETRRNFAAYHRAAWNNLSGLREDLFQQAVLRLASMAAPEVVQSVTAEILRSREAQTVPAHWEALLDGQNPLDLAGYADALRRTRGKLEDVLAENERLTAIASAAQSSGWVRLGAWLGERSARRMMEMEQSTEEPPETPGVAREEAAERP
jgi:hypothetical protein